ncbi:hypothetical protein HUW63_08300 [Myxococcus sp. AM001]|nr:hypothetical protein [Myxococcus sp. AM001]
MNAVNKSHNIIALVIALLGVIAPVVLALHWFSPTERIQHHGPEAEAQALVLCLQLVIAGLCGAASGFLLRRNDVSVNALLTKLVASKQDLRRQAA